MATDNKTTQVSNIELFKQVLNEDTDKGDYTKTTRWLADKTFSDLLGIGTGDVLEWNPLKRELQVFHLIL
jgi:hypothetical protein